LPVVTTNTTTVNSTNQTKNSFLDDFLAGGTQDLKLNKTNITLTPDRGPNITVPDKSATTDSSSTNQVI